MNWFRSAQIKVDQASEKLLAISGIICLALPIIMLIVTGIRTVVPTGIPLWSLDVCELLMWFLTYLGLGFLWRTGRHVKVDVFVNHLHGRWRQMIDIVVILIALGLSSIMIWAGTKACLTSWIDQRRTYNEFPEYIFSIIIPIGLAFLVYEIAVSLVKKISYIRSTYRGKA